MARAEQHHLFSGRIEHIGNRLHYAFAFGVFADHRPLVAEDEIDGADHGRRFGRAFQQGDDGLLVRVGTMGRRGSPAPAARARRRRGSPGRLQRSDIASRVVMGEGLLNHVLRGVAADGAGQ